MVSCGSKGYLPGNPSGKTAGFWKERWLKGMGNQILEWLLSMVVNWKHSPAHAPGVRRTLAKIVEDPL